MTELRSGKILKRKTATIVRRRPLAISLHPGFLEVWQSGMHKHFTLSYEAIFNLAARLEADRVRAEKKESRKRRAA